MYELLQECVKIVNLPYTILFGLSLLYWLLYLVGALGSDFLHFMHLDGNVDLDVDLSHHGGVELLDHGGVDLPDHGGVDLHHPGDVDLHHDGDVDLQTHGGGVATVMKFMHAGDVPLTVIVSALSMSMWVASVLTNYYMQNESGAIALGLAIPIVLVGMIATRVGLSPFVPLLRNAFDESGDAIEILGKPCVVVSLEVTPKYGQAEIATDGAPLAINVKTKEGETLKKGDEAVVYNQDREDNIYLVTKLDIDSVPEVGNGI